jgi:hypothetical protein
MPTISEEVTGWLLLVVVLVVGWVQIYRSCLLWRKGRQASKGTVDLVSLSVTHIYAKLQF